MGLPKNDRVMYTENKFEIRRIVNGYGGFYLVHKCRDAPSNSFMCNRNAGWECSKCLEKPPQTILDLDLLMGGML